MKLNRKFVSLDICYTHTHELAKILNQVKSNIQNGISVTDEKIDSASYSYTVAFDEGENCQIRVIDGQWCRVYQSKMNQDKTIEINE